MKTPGLALALTALAIAGVGPRMFASQDRSDRVLLACSVYTLNTTEGDLRARFGPENVTTGSVPDPNGAEGDRTDGTILFEKNPDARLEISWKDAAAKRQLAVISRMAAHGPWQTQAGIRLGTDLRRSRS